MQPVSTLCVLFCAFSKDICCSLSVFCRKLSLFPRKHKEDFRKLPAPQGDTEIKTKSRAWGLPEASPTPANSFQSATWWPLMRDRKEQRSSILGKHLGNFHCFLTMLTEIQQCNFWKVAHSTSWFLLRKKKCCTKTKKAKRRKWLHSNIVTVTGQTV